MAATWTCSATRLQTNLIFLLYSSSDDLHTPNCCFVSFFGNLLLLTRTENACHDCATGPVRVSCQTWARLLAAFFFFEMFNNILRSLCPFTQPKAAGMATATARAQAGNVRRELLETREEISRDVSRAVADAVQDPVLSAFGECFEGQLIPRIQASKGNRGSGKCRV